MVPKSVPVVFRRGTPALRGAAVAARKPNTQSYQLPSTPVAPHLEGADPGLSGRRFRSLDLATIPVQRRHCRHLDLTVMCDLQTELFRASWSAYDTIIRENYMFHREIHARLREVIAGRAALGGYSLLDLGCGNASGLAETLRDFPPTSYLGVDLSPAALEGAARSLAGLPVVELREQEMLKCLADLVPGSADVVYSGFAMHHLPQRDKRRMFEAIAEVRSPGGMLLLVDVVREPGESRAQYLESYLRMVATEWPALSAAQLREVCQHVAEHDFPESGPVLEEMASQVGLTQCRVLARHRQHYAMLFS